MYDDILLPLDGSRGAEGAITRAFDLARTDDATLHILYVVDTGSEPFELDTGERGELQRKFEKRGRQVTTRVQEQATEFGLETVRHVREGIPYRMILSYTTENAIDLVVMGTHGWTGAERSRLGSTTERVITLADVPVMAVRLAEDVDIPASGYTMYDQVVIPTDGSEFAERAAEHGFEIAERYGADVHVIYIIDTVTYGFEDAPRSIVGLLKKGGQNAVDALTADATDRHLPVTGEILRGVPEEELLNYADGVGADLLVMGTHGHSVDSDRSRGSTTARVVRRSKIPILAVS